MYHNVKYEYKTKISTQNKSLVIFHDYCGNFDILWLDFTTLCEIEIEVLEIILDCIFNNVLKWKVNYLENDNNNRFRNT